MKTVATLSDYLDSISANGPDIPRFEVEKYRKTPLKNHVWINGVYYGFSTSEGGSLTRFMKDGKSKYIYMYVSTKCKVEYGSRTWEELEQEVMEL